MLGSVEIESGMGAYARLTLALVHTLLLKLLRIGWIADMTGQAGLGLARTGQA